MSELVSKGGNVHAECRCGRVALFDTRELLADLTRKGWTAVWPGLARKLRCTECGERSPRVSWKVDGSSGTDGSGQAMVLDLSAIGT